MKLLLEQFYSLDSLDSNLVFDANYRLESSVQFDAPSALASGLVTDVYRSISGTSGGKGKPLLNEGGSDFAGNASTNGIVTVNGDSVTGALSNVNDIDWIRISNPDQFSVLTLDFTSDASLGVNVFLHEYDAYTNIITRTEQLSAEANGNLSFSLDPFIVANPDGIYFLEFSPRNGNLAQYTFTVSQDAGGDDEFGQTAATAGVIEIDMGAITGRMNSGADVDWLRIDNPNDIELFELSYVSGEFSELMQLTLIGIDADGTGGEIYRNQLITDISGSVSFQLPDLPPDTVFFIEVTGIEGFVFDYSLTLSSVGSGQDDFAGGTNTTGVLTLGKLPTTGLLETGSDSDWFSFTAQEGQVFDFAVLRQGSDEINTETTFVVRDANGQIVNFFDYAPSELHNEVTFIAPEAGTYFIDVSAGPGWSQTLAQTVPNYGAYEIYAVLSPLPTSLAPAFQVAYRPWTALPDIGARPEGPSWQGGTFFVENDFTIASHETFFWGYDSNDAALTGMSLTGMDAQFVNQGRIYVEDLFGFVENDNFPLANNSWAIAVAGGNASLFRNEGDVVAVSSLYLAAGFFDVTGFTKFENFGNIFAVSAYGDALGADSVDSTQLHQNLGLIDVWAGNFATGYALNNGGAFTNSGTINVNGYSGATGVELGGLLSSFENSGDIFVNSDRGNEVGVLVIEANGLGGSNSDQVNIINSGTISAFTAILGLQTTDPTVLGSGQYIRIENSGAINGNIILDMGNDRIINTGSVDGLIFMGAGDDEYLGAIGEFSGAIFLEDGDDIAIFGAGDQVIVGGAGDDTLTGGAGADRFIFGVSDGADIITDFELGVDTIELALSPYTSLSTLREIATQMGNDVHLDFGGGNSLTLQNMSIWQLSLSDFYFDDGSGDGPGPFLDPGLTDGQIKEREQGGNSGQGQSGSDKDTILVAEPHAETDMPSLSALHSPDEEASDWALHEYYPFYDLARWLPNYSPDPFALFNAPFEKALDMYLDDHG